MVERASPTHQLAVGFTDILDNVVESQILSKIIIIFFKKKVFYGMPGF